MEDSNDSILKDVCLQLSSNQHNLQHLSEGIHAVRNRFQKYKETTPSDNEITGFVVEQFVVEFLKDNLNDFRVHETSVTDFIYRDTKFAFRVISGKSHLNLERLNKKIASPSYKHFSWKNPVLLLNLKKEKWGNSSVLDVGNCCEEIESTGLFCDKEFTSNRILGEGFYVLSGDDLREKSTLSYPLHETILLDEVLGLCLCEAADDNRFIALPTALGLKKFTLSRGVQWK